MAVKSHRILVVEDEKDFNSMLCKVLRHQGYDVIGVSSGEDAIEEAKSHNYWLVIVDFKLPGINGVQTYKAIAETEPDIKFLVITGYLEKKTIDDILSRTCVCLFKPFELNELLKIIKALEEEKCN